MPENFESYLDSIGLQPKKPDVSRETSQYLNGLGLQPKTKPELATLPGPLDKRSQREGRRLRQSFQKNEPTAVAQLILGDETSERIYRDIAQHGQITDETAKQIGGAKKAFLSFAGGASTAILEPLTMAAELTGYADFAESLRRDTRKISAMTTFPHHRKEFEVDDLLDGEFWATKGSSLLPPTLMLLPIALGGGAVGTAGGAAGARALGMSTRAQGVAQLIGSMFGAGAASAPAEGFMEAAGTFEQTRESLLNQGFDKKKANQIAGTAAANTFKRNLALLAGTNSLEFGLAFAKVPAPLRKSFVRYMIKRTRGLSHLARKAAINGPRAGLALTAGSGSEAAEEVIQGWFQNTAEEWVQGFRPEDELEMADLMERVKRLDPETQEEAASGMIMGLLFQSVGGIERLKNKYGSHMSNLKDKIKGRGKEAISDVEKYIREEAKIKRKKAKREKTEPDKTESTSQTGKPQADLFEEPDDSDDSDGVTPPPPSSAPSVDKKPRKDDSLTRIRRQKTDWDFGDDSKDIRNADNIKSQQHYWPTWVADEHLQWSWLQLQTGQQAPFEVEAVRSYSTPDPDDVTRLDDDDFFKDQLRLELKRRGITASHMAKFAADPPAKVTKTEVPKKFKQPETPSAAITPEPPPDRSKVDPKSQEPPSQAAQEPELPRREDFSTPDEVDRAVLKRTEEIDQESGNLEDDPVMQALDRIKTQIVKESRQELEKRRAGRKDEDKFEEPEIDIELKEEPDSDKPKSQGAIHFQDVDKIGVNQRLFQPREEPYDDTTVVSVQDAIKQGKAEEITPITIWQKPKSHEFYVLDGHSRLEAFKREGEKRIPVKIFSGTPDEAVKFANQKGGEKNTKPAPKTEAKDTSASTAIPQPGKQKPKGKTKKQVASKKSNDYGAKNKVFTTEAAEKARRRLRAKMSQLNTGIDPEMLQDGITLAGYHIEAGTRKFADYAKAMVNDLGEGIRPFLRSFYEGVRHYPGFDNSGMSTANEIDSYLDKEKTSHVPRDRWVPNSTKTIVLTITEDDFSQDLKRFKRLGDFVRHYNTGVTSFSQRLLKGNPLREDQLAKIFKRIENAYLNIPLQDEKKTALGDKIEEFREGTIFKTESFIEQNKADKTSTIKKKQVDRTILKGEYDVSGSTKKDTHETHNLRPVKKFTSDIRKFARVVQKRTGWEYYKKPIGKGKTVGINVAPVGGEATFILFKPGSDFGVYITVPVQRGDDNSLIVAGFTKNPILWRTTDRKKPYESHKNNFAPRDISAEELAELAIHAVESLESRDSEKSKSKEGSLRFDLRGKTLKNADKSKLSDLERKDDDDNTSQQPGKQGSDANRKATDGKKQVAKSETKEEKEETKTTKTEKEVLNVQSIKTEWVRFALILESDSRVDITKDGIGALIKKIEAQTNENWSKQPYQIQTIKRLLEDSIGTKNVPHLVDDIFPKLAPWIPGADKKLREEQREHNPEGLTQSQFDDRVDKLEKDKILKPGEAELVKKLTATVAQRWASWNNQNPDFFYRRAIMNIVYEKNDVMAIQDEFRHKKKIKNLKSAARTKFWPDGMTYISIFREDADIRTILHELGHVFVHYLPPNDLAVATAWAHNNSVEGPKNPNEWTREAHERWAVGFEKYLLTGEAPNLEIKAIFEKIKRLLVDIFMDLYQKGATLHIDNIDMDLPGIRKVYDNLFKIDENDHRLNLENRGQTTAGNYTYRIKSKVIPSKEAAQLLQSGRDAKLPTGSLTYYVEIYHKPMDITLNVGLDPNDRGVTTYHTKESAINLALREIQKREGLYNDKNIRENRPPGAVSNQPDGGDSAGETSGVEEKSQTSSKRDEAPESPPRTKGRRKAGTSQKGIPGQTEKGREELSEKGSDRTGDEKPDRTGNARTPVGITPGVKSEPEGTQSDDRDFRITDDVPLGKGGKRKKFNDNLAAIRVLKKIESENRPATHEEQTILVRYVGWGGLAQEAFSDKQSHRENYSPERSELRKLLTNEEYAAATKSTLNAHYTSRDVVKGIYSAFEHMGFSGGRVIEPGSGIGNFIGLLPDNLYGKTKFTAIEMESLSGRISKALYPSIDLRLAPYQETNLSNNTYDAMIGNVPFGDISIYDKEVKRTFGGKFSIHNYFFLKSILKLRPGGIIGVITSRYTMDSKKRDFRKLMDKHALFLGAIRLPRETFMGNAGTEVVTDILFFKKRTEGVKETGPKWIETKEITGIDGNKIVVSEYYADHPEMMVGDASLKGSMYRSDEPTWSVDKPEEIGQRIVARVKQLPENIYNDRPKTSIKNEQEGIDFDEEPKDQSKFRTNDRYIRQGSLIVPPGSDSVRVVTSIEWDNDQKVVTNERLNLKPSDRQRLIRYVKIRDSLRYVFDSQTKGLSDKEKAQARVDLNDAYDEFVKHHGPINKPFNRRLYDTEPEGFRVLAIENYDEEEKTAEKTDIFEVDVIPKKESITTVNNASDALLVSLNEKGKVDLEHMASIYGQSIPNIINELEGAIFKTTGGEWQTQDEYLSGDVVAKLERVEIHAKKDSSFLPNVEALKKVQPKPLTAAEIRPNLGGKWIPVEDIESFLDHITGGNNSWKVSYISKLHTYKIKRLNNDYDPNLINRQWGTSERPATDLTQDALNNRTPVVTTTDEVTGKRITLEKETRLAQQKMERIKKEFGNWAFAEPERRQRLVEAYNKAFNNLRLRRYDGSHLEFYGMSEVWRKRLNQHQKDACWRCLQGNTLIGHVVGAGKTATMVAAGMEGKRIGLYKKPLYIVPNHMLPQWTNDFLSIYPNANLLVATKKNFNGKVRKQFIARAATGNYDAIIMTHSSLKFVPISPEAEKRYIDQELIEYEAALGEARKAADGKNDGTVKKIQAEIEKFKERLKELNDINRDEVVTFEEMGVDMLFVDESHNFKNLHFQTKMNKVLGLGSTQGGKKTFDLYMKTKRIMEYNGREEGIIFSTGTPVSNTLGEMYLIMKYLIPNTIKALGIDHFDSWVGTFARAKTETERTSAGTYEPRTRLTKFVNLPELGKLFRSFADIRTYDDLPDIRKNLPTLIDNGPIPVIAKETSELHLYMQSLIRRVDELSGKRPERGEDNHLVIANDARSAGLDIRLVRPDVTIENLDEKLKVQLAAEKISEIFFDTKDEKTTQIVFADLGAPKKNKFDIYNELRRLLIDAKVPKNQIAFIHDASTDNKKETLFRKVNSGNIRILIGSTAKLGEGTNVQKRLKAIHHLDAPWKPSQVEQRNGRIIRRGNINDKVYEFRYATEKSFDTNMWQKLEQKSKFIAQVMTKDLTVREADDIGDPFTANAAEMKAITSGDPRIQELVQLENDIRNLESLSDDHRSTIYQMQDQLISKPKEIERYEKRLARAKDEQAQAEKNSHLYEKDNFEIEVQSTKINDKEEAGKAILKTIQKMPMPERSYMTSFRKIGSYRGFDIQGAKSKIVFSEASDHLVRINVELFRNETYNILPSKKEFKGVIRYLNNRISDLPNTIKHLEQQIVRTQKELETAKELVDKPFEQEEELKAKVARRDEILSELAGEKDEVKNQVVRNDISIERVIADNPDIALLHEPNEDLRSQDEIDRQSIYWPDHTSNDELENFIAYLRGSKNVSHKLDYETVRHEGLIDPYEINQWEEANDLLEDEFNSRYIEQIQLELMRRGVKQSISRNDAESDSLDMPESEVGSPPRSKDEYISAADFRADIRKNYFDVDQRIASSRTKPAEFKMPEIGLWRISETSGKYGRDIEQLQLLNVDDLVLTEDDFTKSNTYGKGDDAKRYAEWLREQGTTAQMPPIEVIVSISGKLKVIDGHRRVAAAKMAGMSIVSAWVSDVMDTGLTDISGQPIFTTMTYEGMKYGPQNAAVRELDMAEPEFASSRQQAAPPPDPILGSKVQIQTGGKMQLQPAQSAENVGEKPLPATKVISAIADIVRAAGRDVPVRVGRFAPQQHRYAGFYKVKSRVIRVRTALNIDTACHELAHALEDAVFGSKPNPWTKSNAGINGKMQKELVKLGKDLYGKMKPKAGYKREGFAEFCAYYCLTDVAIDKAPNFYRWFTSEFLANNPELNEKFEDARALAKQWKEQGALQRARSGVVRGGIKEFWNDPAELVRYVKAKYSKVRLKAQLVDAGAPLEELSKAAAEIKGRPLPIEDDPYLIRSALAITHAARVKYMVDHGMIDIAGNKREPSLADATALVKENRDEFTIYLWARRAIELWQSNRNPGLDLRDAMYIKEYYERQEETGRKFPLAAAKVYEWNDGLLRYAVQAGALTPKMYGQIRKSSRNYIPLQRIFDDIDFAYGRIDRSGGGRILGSNPIKRLKGSGRRIRDPFQTMIENADTTVKSAHQRMVIDKMIHLEDVEGIGKFIEQIPVNQIPVKVPTADVLQKLIDTMSDNGLDIEVEDGDGDMQNNAISKFITFFTPATYPSGQDPIVPYWNNQTNKIEWYQVSEDMYRSLSGMDIYRLPKFLDFFFGKTARAFRLGTTGIRASFALFTNPIRDFQSFVAQSNSSAHIGKMMMAWTKGFGNAFLGTFTGKDSEYFDLFKRLGGEMALPLGIDTSPTRRAATELFQDRKMRIITHPIDHLRDVLQIPEAATRTAELRLRAQEIGWDGRSNLSLNQSLQLLLDAKRVTVDFTAAGEFMRVVNQIIPFSNASVQGQRTFYRALTSKDPKRRRRALLAGGSMTAITIMLWLLNKDEDWYNDMPYTEKYLYWHFATDWPKPMILRLPRAHEWGVMFSAMPEAMLDAWYKQDPKAVSDWIQHFVDLSNPGIETVEGVPFPFPDAPLIRFPMEIAANRTAFGNRVITPERLKRLPEEERFTEYTSSAAKTIGSIFGVAPTTVDHAIRSFTGGVGRDISNAHTFLAKLATGKEFEAADVPVIGVLSRRGGKDSFRSNSVDKFYRALEETQRRQYSNVSPETEFSRRKRLLMEDAARALSVLFYLRRNTDDLSTRSRLSREIRSIARRAIASWEGMIVSEKQRAPFRQRARELRKLRDKRENMLKRLGT